MDEKQDKFNTGAMVSMMNLLANGSNAHGDEVALARSVLLSRISSCSTSEEALRAMIAWLKVAKGIVESCNALFPSLEEEDCALN